MVYKLEKSEFWHISVAFLLLFTMVYHTSLNTSLITLIIAGDWGSMSLFRLFIDPIPIAFIFGLTFLVHELSHLNTGKHFKYQSRFCLTKVGIKTTSWAALIGIPFGLPGAAISVGVDPNHDKHQMGWIKIAGPASNFVLGLIFLIGGLVIPVQSILLFKIKFYLLQGASINFVLGAFNMIPRVVKGFALDGEYIIKWNILYYIILVLLLIAGFAGTYLVLNWLQNPDTLQAFIDQSIFTFEDFGKYIR